MPPSEVRLLELLVLVGCCLEAAAAFLPAAILRSSAGEGLDTFFSYKGLTLVIAN